VTLVSATSPQGTCSGSAPVDCDLGTLAPGATATVTITVTPGKLGTLTDAAQLSATETDPHPENNTATTANAVALPPPVPGVATNVAPARGTVTIKLPGSAGFVALTGPQQIPVGSTVDTSNGSIRLTSAEGTTLFYAGKFVVGERGGVTVATLTGGDFRTCPRIVRKARRTSALDPRRRVVRRLWGNGTGRFRTSGRLAAASVRGTLWVVEDRCDGTITRVRRGTVLVTNLKTKKTFVVRAGHSYLAPA